MWKDVVYHIRGTIHTHSILYSEDQGEMEAVSNPQLSIWGDGGHHSWFALLGFRAGSGLSFPYCHGQWGPTGPWVLLATGHPSSPISCPQHLRVMFPVLAVPLLELITVIIPALLCSNSLLLSFPCPFICKSNLSMDFLKRKRVWRAKIQMKKITTIFFFPVATTEIEEPLNSTRCFL